MQPNDEQIELKTSRRVEFARERTILANERTRLAAERTFLAWIRTGLTGIGGGFAIIRLISFQTFAHRIIADIVGLLLIVWGIGIFVLAFFDYRKSCLKLEKTIGYPIPVWDMASIAIALIVLSCLLLSIALFNF